MRNIETASVVTSYETNYQTTQSLRRKLDRAMTTLVRIRAERDHIKQEYKLIMAERDNVHRDIEQLQEQVQELFTSLQLEQQKSSHFEQKLNQVCTTQPKPSSSNQNVHSHLLEISQLKAQLLQTEKERDQAIHAAFHRSASTSPELHGIIQDKQEYPLGLNKNNNNNNNSSCNSENQLIQSSESEVIPLKNDNDYQNHQNSHHPHHRNNKPSKVHSIMHYILCCIKD